MTRGVGIGVPEFPVIVVENLSELLEFFEFVGPTFSLTGDGCAETGGKTMVEEVGQGSVSPVRELELQAVEVRDVAGHVMGVFHGELAELLFGTGLAVGVAEALGELLNERVVGVAEVGEWGVRFLGHEDRGEPVKG